MKKKEARSAILYARVTPSSLAFMHDMRDKLGYKSTSEFLDVWFRDAMKGMGIKDDRYTGKLPKRSRQAL